MQMRNLSTKHLTGTSTQTFYMPLREESSTATIFCWCINFYSNLQTCDCFISSISATKCVYTRNVSKCLQWKQQPFPTSISFQNPFSWRMEFYCDVNTSEWGFFKFETGIVENRLESKFTVDSEFSWSSNMAGAKYVIELWLKSNFTKVLNTTEKCSIF